MKIDMSVKILRAAAKLLPETKAEQLSWKTQYLREGESFELEIADFDILTLKAIYTALKEAAHPSSRILSSMIKTIEDPENKKITSLEVVPKVLKVFLEENFIRGWLIEQMEATKPIAWLMSKCEYEMGGSIRNDPPHVEITLGANSKHIYRERKIHLYSNDVRGRTITEILLSQGLLLETKELLEDYDKVHKRYFEFRGMQAEQFLCKGKAYIEEKSGRNNWWSDSKLVDLAPVGEPTFAVLDEDGYQSDNYGKRNDERSTFPSSLFKKTCQVPWHPLLYCFHLKYHQGTWINTRQLKPYEYDEGLPDKLIMPKSHIGLVNALTSNIFIAPLTVDENKKKSRVIRSKAQSTIILCRGPAGTGKTLLAEVYAEKLHRPLYEVNSGQIGVEPEEVEENMQDILERSKRLKAPLVINEADVFVQERGNDLKQNAVCSVFLRCLEYHNGLIFLTTNRDQTIDDAIVSRCLAIITVKLPDEEGRIALWTMLSQELDLELSSKVIAEAAAKLHPISGRDIQNLIRLVKRRVIAEKLEAPTYKLLRTCAVFRGIEIKDDK
jgi:hypothetical protein